MRRNASWLAMFLFLLVAAGCSQNRGARYVYRDGNHGVIGLADHTNRTRRRAEALMAQHFPDGFDIVREEEIETGSRKSDWSRLRNKMIKPGAGAAEFLIGMGTASSETSTKYVDDIKLHELRVIYQNRQGEAQSGFTTLASINPQMYNDPNRKLRDLDEESLLATAKPASKADADVKQASKPD